MSGSGWGIWKYTFIQWFDVYEVTCFPYFGISWFFPLGSLYNHKKIYSSANTKNTMDPWLLEVKWLWHLALKAWQLIAYYATFKSDILGKHCQTDCRMCWIASVDSRFPSRSWTKTLINDIICMVKIACYQHSFLIFVCAGKTVKFKTLFLS